MPDGLYARVRRQHPLDGVVVPRVFYDGGAYLESTGMAGCFVTMRTAIGNSEAIRCRARLAV